MLACWKNSGTVSEFSAGNAIIFTRFYTCSQKTYFCITALFMVDFPFENLILPKGFYK